MRSTFTVVGAHLRNEARLRPGDIELYKTAKFRGALCMWYQDPAELVAAGIDPAHSIVRLPDSDPYITDCRALADIYTYHIKRWIAWGFRRYQIDNEPDLAWGGKAIPDGATAWDYWAWLLRTALEEPSWGVHSQLRAAGIGSGDIELGLTPLSCGCAHAGWNAVLDRLAHLCRWTAAHCYWQGQPGEAWYENDDFGRYWQRFARRFPWLTVYITECGYSASDARAGDRAYIDACMVAHYPRYIRQCIAEGAAGLYFYVLGSNGHWTRFELSAPVCEAVGNRLAHTVDGPRWGPVPV